MKTKEKPPSLHSVYIDFLFSAGTASISIPLDLRTDVMFKNGSYTTSIFTFCLKEKKIKWPDQPSVYLKTYFLFNCAFIRITNKV